jgi:hypothetical protein
VEPYKLNIDSLTFKGKFTKIKYFVLFDYTKDRVVYTYRRGRYDSWKIRKHDTNYHARGLKGRVYKMYGGRHQVELNFLLHNFFT